MPDPQPIETLQRRHTELDRRRVQAETELSNLRAQLEELKTMARQEFGTDDPAELRATLERTRAENLRRRADYQEHLDGIERDVRAIEDAARAGTPVPAPAAPLFVHGAPAA